MSVWRELQRRKVVRVAVVYAVTAWILIQIVVAIAGPLSLPDWVDTFVIVLLGLGFPVALILSWAFDVKPDGITAASERAVPSAAPSAPWFSHAGQILILLAVGFLVANQFILGDGSPAPASAAGSVSRATQRVSITLPVEHTAAFGWRPGHSLAISPDGRTIAYTASAWDDQSQVHHLAVRELGSLDAREIPGSTDGGFSPFFSPDSRWVAFFTQGGQLMKALLAGGAAIEIARDVVGGVWATGVWTDTNEIVFRDRRGLHRVSADGGTPEELGGENLIGEWLGRPDYVRAANAVLAVNTGPSNRGALVAIDLDTGVRKTVLDDVRAGRFVPTGHLVVQRGAAVLLMAIDPATLEVQGEAVPLSDAIRADGLTGDGGFAQFDVADNGDLVYAQAGEARSELYVVDRQGVAERLPFPADLYGSVSVSPDGKTLAVDIRTGGVLLLDHERGTQRRLPARNPRNAAPSWRPDGASIVTISGGPEGEGVVETVLGGESRWLWQYDGDGYCCRNFSWLPDQEALLMVGSDGAHEDIMMMSLDGAEPRVTPLIATPAEEYAPRVSPDGKWLAYISTEAGQPQLYIRPFPDGVDVPVSRDFAQGPIWSRDSSELYFQGTHEGAVKMLAVKIAGASGATPDLSDVEPLFPLRSASGPNRIDAYRASTNGQQSFAVLPDGRFVMSRSAEQSRYRELVLIQNLALPAHESAD